MHFLPFLLLSFLLAFSATSFGVDKTKKQKQLTQLKSKIEKLRKTIEVKENSKSSYYRQLREIEKKIGAISRKIRLSNQSIRKQQKALSRLKKNKAAIQQQLKQQNRLLSQQLYTAYTLGQQEQMKLLFSQQNASNIQRNLTYYQYFSNYRLQQIDSYNQHFEKLTQNEQKIAEAKQKLEKVLQQQRKQKSKLGSDRIQREKIVKTLEKELKKQGHYLGKLEEDAKNLKQLIDSVTEILTQNPPAQPVQKFYRLKGKLSWPVKGKVRKLFGRAKPPSDLRWQGIIIDAPRGNNVRAIARGRVAFSDWLRGMGNLVIIDHGNGYLSLYGHNESLFKATGEWVEAGDIIGSIGNSGGQNRAGLYFEIRRKGKPQNPARWCKASNWFA